MACASFSRASLGLPAFTLSLCLSRRGVVGCDVVRCGEVRCGEVRCGVERVVGEATVARRVCATKANNARARGAISSEKRTCGPVQLPMAVAAALRFPSLFSLSRSLCLSPSSRCRVASRLVSLLRVRSRRHPPPAALTLPCASRPLATCHAVPTASLSPSRYRPLDRASGVSSVLCVRVSSSLPTLLLPTALRYRLVPSLRRATSAALRLSPELSSSRSAYAPHATVAPVLRARAPSPPDTCSAPSQISCPRVQRTQTPYP